MKFDVHGKRVYVAGHRGMVGSALVRRLAREDCQILTASRGEVDLRNQQAVDRWFDEHRPDVVFLAAARVGGIYANNAQPGDFLYDNLALQTNLIEAARRVQVAKLLFFWFFLHLSAVFPADRGR
jgi:GDP-L-fucose synthase